MIRKLFLGITAAALLAGCAAPAAAPSETGRNGGRARAKCYSAGQLVLELSGISSYYFYSYGWTFNTEGGKISTNAVCVVNE